MKKLKLLRGILDYLLAIIFVSVFALYCSGRVGYFLLLVFFLAPVISVGSAYYFSRKIECEFYMNSTDCAKGEELHLISKIYNSSILPTPVIKIEFIDNKHFEISNQLQLVSVLPHQTQETQADYKAIFAGGSVIGIESIRIIDFFGIVSFSLRKFDENNAKFAVGIIPEVEYAPCMDDFVKEALSSSVQGDSEETLDEAASNFGGFPGYEYRQYQIGDPIKRINYKLSAKKNEYWVRLDEKRVVSKLKVLIDFANTKESEDVVLVQNTLEMILGFIQSLLLREYAVELVTYEGNAALSIKTFEIVDESQLLLAAKSIAKYSFEKKRSHDTIPEQLYNLQEAVVLITPHWDEVLLAEIEQLKTGNGSGVIENIHTFCIEEGGGAHA